MNVRRNMRAGVLVSAVVALALSSFAPASARAHGEAPVLMQLLFHPTEPDTMVIVASFGLLVTEDAGTTWDWVCTEAIWGEYILPGRGFIDSEGTVTLASPQGVLRGEALGCNWSRPSAQLDGVYVVDLHADPANPSFAVALTYEPDAISGVFGTEDAGRNWVRWRAPFPARLLSLGVRAAPSDPGRVYVTGISAAGTRAYLFRSDGEPDRWDEFELGGDRSEFAMPLLGVDPADRNRVYLRAVSAAYDRVAVSDDGGQTFRDLALLDAPALAAGRPFGFAFASDGSVWVGNPITGLLRLEGETFRTIRADLEVTHIDVRGADLWIGLDGRAGDEMAELVRAPMGDTDALEPVMSYEQVTGVRTCATPHVREVCDPFWDDLRRHVDLLPPLEAGAGSLDAGVLMPDAGPDAGVAPPDGDASMVPSTSPTGCGCHAVSPGADPWLALSVALMLLGCLRLRRRTALL